MASGWTNRGKFNTLNERFRDAAEPTNYFVALVLATPAPGPDTNLFGDTEADEIAAGNGYTAGGISLARNSTDFDVLTEDDTNDRALIQIKNLVWTASGGNLPSAGGGARFAILTDDNVTQTAREVEAYWDLVSDRTISDTQTLTLIDCELRLTE